MSELVPLGIEGAWLFKSPIHVDDRGFFREWYQADILEKTLGKKLAFAQSNLSRSKKGVIRGIHYSTAPEGQAKWITCANGTIWDVIVDIRPESPTFKKWVACELTALNGFSVYISEGLGHGFAAIEEDSVINYLLSTPYSPHHELAINPLDPEISINWPVSNPIISERDRSAPEIKKISMN